MVQSTECSPAATAAQRTVLFRRLGERQLHSATVGVVALAHATLVLLLVRAHLLVAADVLRAKARESQSKGHGHQPDILTVRAQRVARMAECCRHLVPQLLTNTTRTQTF